MWTTATPTRSSPSPHIRQVFRAPLVLTSEYDGALAEAGRPFLANPGLPRRMREGLPLNESNVKTWYSQGPEGYTDYPFAP